MTLTVFVIFLRTRKHERKKEKLVQDDYIRREKGTPAKRVIAR